MTSSARLQLTPQMREYDALDVVWRPLVMYYHTPGICNDVIRTDAQGFRYSTTGDRWFSPTDSLEKDRPTAALVGGSTAFGVGASSDATTIPSVLSKSTGLDFLNFGGRAFNGSQELVLFQKFMLELPELRQVVIFSGVNDLYLSQYRRVGEVFGAFFFEKQFIRAMNEEVLMGPKRRLARALLRPLLGNSVDYGRCSVQDLKRALLSGAQGLKSTDLLPVDVDYALSQAERNLAVWKVLANGAGFELTYALQPLPQWSGHDLSDEEKTLFTELDQTNPSMLTWDKGMPPHAEYASKIEALCRSLGIRFTDLNPILGHARFAEKWLFVDRVHLTDLGNAVVADHLREVLA